MKDVKPEEVSKETARRFLISRQSFLRGERGKDGTLEVIKRLECVQTDPIAVVHRNHHLVLHSRVVDYRPSYLEDLLYKDRCLFEYWCNEKSVIPIEDFPCFRYRMQNSSQFHSPFYERIKAQKREFNDVTTHVLSEIGKHGPLSTREFKRKGSIKGNVATRVLNLLRDCGDIMIHHAEGNRRYYDLTQRLLPLNAPEMETPSKEEFERFMIQKYMRAYGLVDTRDWRFGWLPLKASQRRIMVNEMVEDDMLYPVKIEGVKHVYYILKEHLSLTESSDTITGEKVHFIAPLDNLLWNRRMVSEIFDFDYVWEAYKVPEKRVYGFYVMPILQGTRFIGRLDPKLDRQNETMIINGLLLEEKRFRKDLIGELVATLQRFSEFHGASQVNIVRTQPCTLKDTLERKLD